MHLAPPQCHSPILADSVTTVQSKVPPSVDQLANIALPLLGSLSRAHLTNAHLLTDTSPLPPADTMRAAYKALQGRTRSHLV